MKSKKINMKKFSERRKIVESIPSETFYCYKPDIAKNIEAEKNAILQSLKITRIRLEEEQNSAKKSLVTRTA